MDLESSGNLTVGVRIRKKKTVLFLVVYITESTMKIVLLLF